VPQAVAPAAAILGLLLLMQLQLQLLLLVLLFVLVRCRLLDLLAEGAGGTDAEMQSKKDSSRLAHRYP
jgi:hypothetical protein